MRYHKNDKIHENTQETCTKRVTDKMKVNSNKEGLQSNASYGRQPLKKNDVKLCKEYI